MLDLASRLQSLLRGAVETLNGLPWWAALVLFVIPTLLALLTKRAPVLAATAVLNGASLILLAHSTSSVAGAIVLFALSLLAALYGFLERDRQQRLQELEAQLEHVREQMMVFLQALDRRSDELDKMRDQAAAAVIARTTEAPRAGSPGAPLNPFQTPLFAQPVRPQQPTDK